MSITGSLADVQLKLLKDGSFSDMTVICKDRTWKCHRSVLCRRCPFFEAACNGDFKESKTLVVKLEDDPAEGVDVLLEYLYTLGVPNFNKTAGQGHLRAEYAFTIGDKYGLSQLRVFGCEKLIEGIRDDYKYWDKKTDIQKQQLIKRIVQMWSWKQEGSARIREVCLQQITNMTSMLDDQRFKDQVLENKDFVVDLVKHTFQAKRR